MVYEIVINISVAKEQDTLDEIVQSCGSVCIDVHKDIDHNRSVLTLASNDLDKVVNAAYLLVGKTFDLIDLAQHLGVHPRLGIVDVVPFVSYDEKSIEPTLATIEKAQDFGEQLYSKFEVPIFFYDYACEQKTTLPHIRKNAFLTKRPNFGIDTTHEKYGSICIGAREPLIAINVNFDSQDLTVAKNIASKIRESSGGFKGIRAIGLELKSQKRVQVSMNVVNTIETDLEKVLLTVIKDIEKLGHKSEIELVGLMPQYVFENFTDEFKQKHGLSIRDTIEYRLSHPAMAGYPIN